MKRFGFPPIKPATSTPNPDGNLDRGAIAARPALAQGIEEIRKSVAPRFAEAGVDLDDDALIAIVTATSTAVTAARAAAVETVIALRRSAK